MSEIIPLSRRAYNALYGPMELWVQSMFLGLIVALSGLVAVLFGLILLLSTPWFILVPGMFLILILDVYLFHLMVLKPYRKNKGAILAENREDYELAQAINQQAVRLAEEPLDLDAMEPVEVTTLTILHPVSLDYLPEATLLAQLRATFSGNWGLFSLGGIIEGRVEGQSSPMLTHQNYLLICSDVEGRAVRLLSPSVLILRDSLLGFIGKLKEQYGAFSHTAPALERLFAGKDGLEEQLLKLNPGRVFDQIRVNLEKPQEQRPAVSVRGVRNSQGNLLVLQIGIAGEPAATTLPLRLMDEVREILRGVLPLALPAGN